MTTEADNTAWAITALDMAFTPKLSEEARDEGVALILRYFKDAAAQGVSLDYARMALYNELLDTMPVIEPLKRVLQRTLKSLRESV